MRLRTRIDRLVKLLRRFLGEQKGVTLPLIAASFLVMTASVGAAIDVARKQLVQARLSYALDAAGLAAGSTVDTSNVSQEVSKYMNANFPTGYLGAAVPTTTVQVTSDNQTLNLTASTSMPTTFMRAFGITSMTVSATSQVTRSASGLEIVMVLDNTGSMTQSAGGTTSKLSALKTAASTLVDVLYGGQSSVPDLWIGLVPFSQAVNIGTGHPTWLDTTYNNGLSWGPTSWAGCVDARVMKSPPVQLVVGSSGTYDGDVTDDPPAVTKFRDYYWPSDDNNCWAWKTSKKGSKTCTNTSPTNYSSSMSTTSIGPNLYCPQQVTQMTSDKTALKNAINSMTAQGNTHIDLGLVWGWRMLSPRWQGQWGGEMDSNGLPLDYNTAHMSKAVILLTDGDNTVGSVSSGDRSAYWYLDDGKLGTTSNSTAVSQLNARTTQVCNSLKANGVYIYTIALGSSISSTAKSLLQGCATAKNYYFDSPSTSTLQSIFSAIGDSLSNLRVSQ